MARATARTWVALLRGINVGGKNKLPMAALAALFAEAGAGEVRTYIQSGNVVYRAAAGEAIAATVGERIAARHRLTVPIVVRAGAELAEVARNHPFAARAVDDKALHVLFLAARPPAQKIAALDPQRSPDDEFAVVGREIYLWLPNGMARTRLTNDYFDRALATTSTARNWRTVRTLAALAAVSGSR
jgi:uncharacterized protein (DUF1697 family)